MTNHGARAPGRRPAKGRSRNRASNKSKIRVNSFAQDSCTITKKQNASYGIAEASNANSRFQISDVIRMRNPGRRVGLLLNLIKQQMQIPHYLSSSQLRLPTQAGYLPLHQIRALRLRSLFALAQHFDERSCVTVSRCSSSCSNSAVGIHELESDLSSISLSNHT